MKRSDVCLLSESYEAVKVNQLIKTLLEQGKSQEEIHDILVKEGFWDSAKNFTKGAVGGALGLKPKQVTASGIGKKIGTGIGNLLGTNQPSAPESTAEKNVPAEEEDTTPKPITLDQIPVDKIAAGMASSFRATPKKPPYNGAYFKPILIAGLTAAGIK